MNHKEIWLWEEIMGLEPSQRKTILESVSLAVETSENEETERVLQNIRHQFPQCFTGLEGYKPEINTVRNAAKEIAMIQDLTEKEIAESKFKIWYLLKLAGVDMMGWCSGENKIPPEFVSRQIVGRELTPDMWIKVGDKKVQIAWAEILHEGKLLTISADEVVPQESKLVCFSGVEEGKIKI